MTNQTHTLINKESGELAFKMYRFSDLDHFDHIQRLNYFSVIWIQSGKGVATVDFNQFEFTEDYMFSFAPFQPFMFKTAGEVDGLIIQFHTDFFCILKHQKEIACNGVLFNNVYDTPFVIIDTASRPTVAMICDEMEKDIIKNDLALNESVTSYLKLLLINCARLKNQQGEFTAEVNSDESLVVKQLKDLIDQDFREKHSPKDYAEALHITPKALAKISKSYFKKTLTTLISERIIIEAKRELYLTNKPVKEIASELGYDDEFYFSRFFKKNTSITPSYFRKTVGENKATA